MSALGCASAPICRLRRPDGKPSGSVRMLEKMLLVETTVFGSQWPKQTTVPRNRAAALTCPQGPMTDTDSGSAEPPRSPGDRTPACASVRERRPRIRGLPHISCCQMSRLSALVVFSLAALTSAFCAFGARSGNLGGPTSGTETIGKQTVRLSSAVVLSGGGITVLLLTPTEISCAEAGQWRAGQPGITAVTSVSASKFPPPGRQPVAGVQWPGGATVNNHVRVVYTSAEQNKPWTGSIDVGPVTLHGRSYSLRARFSARYCGS
jgi:hypothetical protein